MSSSILWFRQDLRLHDNEALIEAIRNADEVVPVYVFNVKPESVSKFRLKFLIESVVDLRRQLRALGSDLLIRIGKPDEVIDQLAVETKSQWVYCNRERTREEVEVQDSLERKLWTTGREIRYSRGKMLYYTSDLPFPVTHCPDSFISFRKEVEAIVPVRAPLSVPLSLPVIKAPYEPGDIPDLTSFVPDDFEAGDFLFSGGESEGLKAMVKHYHHDPTTTSIEEGLKISPWISMGCLSPKKVYYDSFALEDGGEFIRQHLLYRDFLRLMGKKYGDLIFSRAGIKSRISACDNNPEAFENWKSGNTGIPIIDAAMHQLNRTGWISDVLRKTVANYLIKVLKLDWTLGAAYFESVLIDYDPCSNWVSWLNLAGVGPDSREDRIIHYDIVGKKLDPDGAYVRMWNS
jgi:deoxyribodipyrimidine photo-lyase